MDELVYKRMDKVGCDKFRSIDRLSGLLELALSDIGKVKRDKRYILNMDYYHSSTSIRGGKCLVCLAGSVLVRTLGYPFDEDYSDEKKVCDFDLRRRIEAIDWLRRGCVKQALQVMKWDDEDRLNRLDGIPEWVLSESEDYCMFHYYDESILYYERMVSHLKGVGL